MTTRMRNVRVYVVQLIREFVLEFVDGCALDDNMKLPNHNFRFNPLNAGYTSAYTAAFSADTSCSFGFGS